jgi:hypothetical protein
MNRAVIIWKELYGKDSIKRVRRIAQTRMTGFPNKIPRTWRKSFAGYYLISASTQYGQYKN